MPCRALEAFRQKSSVSLCWKVSKLSLNALSGIGGVQTNCRRRSFSFSKSRLNALSGIGGVQTDGNGFTAEAQEYLRLNALSGIGGVQTNSRLLCRVPLSVSVLMPCRALEAFRRSRVWPGHPICPR